MSSRRFMYALALLAAGCSGGNGDEGTAPDSLLRQEVSDLDPFDDAFLATYEISMDPADWDAMVADPFNDTWRRATVTWRNETYTNVAVHPSGHRSRVVGNPKPSMKLSFDEFVPGREFHHYEKIKLDAMTFDPAMMRERLAYAIYEARGVPVPRCVHARVVVNGAYKGLYELEEPGNKDFVTRRFGQPARQLYDWSRRINDLLWNGPEPLSFYVPRMFVPKIESLPPDEAGVRNLVDVLNNHPYAAVEALFDVPGFLNFIAVEVIVGEGDAYVGGIYPPGTDLRSGNFLLGQAPASGKYVFIAYDRDQSYWRQSQDILTGFDNRLLTRRLILEQPQNLARHKEILRELVQGPHATAAMHARIDYIFNQIRSAALEDPYKYSSNDAWPVEVESIKNYIRNRNEAVMLQVGP